MSKWGFSLGQSVFLRRKWNGQNRNDCGIIEGWSEVGGWPLVRFGLKEPVAVQDRNLLDTTMRCEDCTKALDGRRVIFVACFAKDPPYHKRKTPCSGMTDLCDECLETRGVAPEGYVLWTGPNMPLHDLVRALRAEATRLAQYMGPVDRLADLVDR